jgi:hypothetical protein
MSKTETVPAVAEQYPRDKYNSLLPSQTILDSVSPLYVVRVETVQISAHPDDGEVYPMSAFGGDENKFCLGKSALNKLAQAAGVSFWPQYSGRADDGSNPDRVLFRAVATRRKPDGEPIMVTCYSEVDIATEEGILRKALRKKAKRKGWSREYVEDKVEDMMLKLRKHKVAKADTGAHLRCVRELLGIKSAYTREELKKEFVVSRIDFMPDLSDDRTRELMINRGASAMGGLYAGPSTAPAVGHSSPMTRPAVDAEAEPVDEEHEEDEERARLESEMRALMKNEVITESERAKITSGLKEGMDMAGLKKGVGWLKDNIEERHAILKKENEEAKQLSMPWE